MSDKALEAARRIVDLKARIAITLGNDRISLEDELDDLTDDWTVEEFALAYMALHRRVSDLEDFIRGQAVTGLKMAGEKPHD